MSDPTPTRSDGSILLGRLVLLAIIVASFCIGIYGDKSAPYYTFCCIPAGIVSLIIFLRLAGIILTARGRRW